MGKEMFSVDYDPSKTSLTIDEIIAAWPQDYPPDDSVLERFFTGVGNCVQGADPDAAVDAAGQGWDAFSLLQIPGVIGMQTDNAKVVAGVFAAYTVMDVSLRIADVGTGFAKIDMAGLTLARIHHIVENIEKKVNIVLDTPLKLAMSFVRTALNMIRVQKYKEAYDQFDKVYQESSRAFQYFVQKERSIGNFKDCVRATKLNIFSKLMRFSYDDNGCVFRPFHLLGRGAKDLIVMELEDQVKEMLLLENELKPSLIARLSFSTRRERCERRDLLDSVLKLAYPYISEGKGWTSAWSKLPAADWLEITVRPEFVPEGWEDKTSVLIGNCGDGTVQVEMWRTEQGIHVSNTAEVFQVDDTSEEMQIKIPGQLPLMLISSGLAAELQGDLLGEYLPVREEAESPLYNYMQSHTVQGKGSNIFFGKVHIVNKT